MSLYPVNLDIRDQLCLVFGGGNVASRKVESLLPCGAMVRVITPEANERLAALAGEGALEWLQRSYLPGDLHGAKLVFAATDNEETQEQIAAEANGAGIPVNVATRPDGCTFQVPASFRRGDLLITVATGGKSPALAACIRKDLERVYGHEYAVLVGLLGDVRTEILSLSGKQTEHKRVFENMLDNDILECIKRHRWNRLQQLLQEILPSGVNVPDLVEGTRNRVMNSKS